MKRIIFLTVLAGGCAGSVKTTTTIDADGRRTLTYESTRHGLGVGREDPPTVAAAANAQNAYAEATSQCLGEACKNGLALGYGYGAGMPFYAVGGYTAAGEQDAARLQGLLSPAPNYYILPAQSVGGTPSAPTSGSSGGGGGGTSSTTGTSSPSPVKRECLTDDEKNEFAAVSDEINAMKDARQLPTEAELKSFEDRIAAIVVAARKSCEGTEMDYQKLVAMGKKLATLAERRRALVRK